MRPQDYIEKGSMCIVEAISKERGTPLSPDALLLMEYLKVALNKELIESQRKHQSDSVTQMRHLVYATWALVAVTLLVILLKY